MATLKIHGKTGQLGDCEEEQRNKLLKELKGKTTYNEKELKDFSTNDLQKLHQTVEEKLLKNVGYFGVQANSSSTGGKKQPSRAMQSMLNLNKQGSSGLSANSNLNTNESEELEKLREWDSYATLTPASVLQRRKDLERKSQKNQTNNTQTTGGSKKEPSRAMQTMVNLINK